MAAVEPLRVVALGPSEQTEPFDIHLLCAKLEVAKREREERKAARELRKQVARAVRMVVRESWTGLTRPPIEFCSHGNDDTRAPASIRPGAAPAVRPSMPQQHSTSYVRQPGNVQNSHGLLRSGTAKADREEASHIFISRSTSAGSAQQPDKSPATKRRPFTLFKNLTSDAETRARRKMSKRPNDLAKRRSVTSPTLSTGPQHEDVDGLYSSYPTSSSATYRKATYQHTMGVVNEYTVCFDTTDPYEILESPQSMRPLPINSPSWAVPHESNEGMLGMLSLSSVLNKKDRKDRDRMRMDQISPPYSPTHRQRPAITRTRPHTRRNTAPENLISEAAQRLHAQQQQAKQAEHTERSKKRRSLADLLHTIFVPSHSSSNDSTHAHCVAI